LVQLQTLAFGFSFGSAKRLSKSQKVKSPIGSMKTNTSSMTRQ